ncbi:MAG: branched-chain amino acid ABC transporter permease [Rhodospirillaceae bacterium]|jgi:branched-chain amino acid transport system permease protein|nr:branched-chain amino acid ABC transporter permease [Rhodospirillaceae bacterium]MBT7292504.1 branched-chain amino acid ABC transporter permease [Rhodospirillaceae bacterium]
MDLFIAQLINGIVIGCTYALVATGFNLLVLISGVIHFSYPVVVVFCMYVVWLVFEATGSVALALISSLIAGIALSLAAELLFRPMIKRGAIIQTFIMSLAMAMVLNYLMASRINFGHAISFSESLASYGAAFQFGYSAVSYGQLATVIGSLLLVGALFVFLFATMPGRAFRAVAQNKEVAHLVGINEGRMSIVSFTIAGLLGGTTAIFLAMSFGSAYAGLGDLLALKMIAIVLFAGVGNLTGGLIAAIILGVAETMATGYISGQWSNAVAFGMIFLIVMVRPQGLFGSRV